MIRDYLCLALDLAVGALAAFALFPVGFACGGLGCLEGFPVPFEEDFPPLLGFTGTMYMDVLLTFAS